MSYTLEGRALTEAPEGREVARAPCIFCGRVIGHFNDGGDHHEDGDGVGWIVGAVVDGKPKEFLYCDQPPCAAVKNGGYDAIWRCGCVSDYVENVGDTCAACLCSRENAAPMPD